MKIAYITKRFAVGTLAIIAKADAILEEYGEQGYTLTLRQLYYQFVARDLLPNTQQSYKRLGGIINDARLAGYIDWDRMEDRTRNLRRLADWESPTEIVESCAKQFRLDKWADQDFRPECWIEKDALVGVIEGPCDELQVPYFSCRGYTSQSEVHSAAERLAGYADAGQIPVIFHFGDHDPSGIDMTRDIRDRLELINGHMERVDRLALNMDQVEHYSPPPNPAKMTDSRFAGYVVDFGEDCWELDALEPAVIGGLIREAVTGIRDDDKWQAKVEEETDAKAALAEVADNWESVRDWLHDE